MLRVQHNICRKGEQLPDVRSTFARAPISQRTTEECSGVSQQGLLDRMHRMGAIPSTVHPMGSGISQVKRGSGEELHFRRGGEGRAYHCRVWGSEHPVPTMLLPFDLTAELAEN